MHLYLPSRSIYSRTGVTYSIENRSVFIIIIIILGYLPCGRHRFVLIGNGASHFDFECYRKIIKYRSLEISRIAECFKKCLLIIHARLLFQNLSVRTECRDLFLIQETCMDKNIPVHGNVMQEFMRIKNAY